jgi:hypothetical protein
MLKYADLTKAQKRFVDAVLAEFPAVAETGQVSRKELESIYWTLNDLRASGGEKVGFPNWLTGPNKVARGVFAMPMPETQAKKAKKAVAKEKAAFEAIIDETPILDSTDYTDYDAEQEEVLNAARECAGFED